MTIKFSRRKFLLGGLSVLGALALEKYLNFSSKLEKFLIPSPSLRVPGSIVGASMALGHKLHIRDYPKPTYSEETDLVILGGGISGLSAGYTLAKAGFENFILLDLEDKPGGNSISGNNSVSAYPWGAHYVPLLTEEATAARKLFEELGIITGYDAHGIPFYHEFYLCADPDERLYIYGRWQDGLVPTVGITSDEEKEYQRFFAMMENYKNLKGTDGKRAFAIPVDKSSQDNDLLALDSLTMEEWMDRNLFHSPHLRWYINYCCRDDYGTTSKETSAWAGIHYFASRNGRGANTDSHNVVTWPEGNGWIAHQLIKPIETKIRTQSLALRLDDHGSSVSVEYWDQRKEQSISIKAKAAIVATPHFIASRIIHSPKLSLSAEHFSYCPWMVANITLKRLPSGPGTAIAWDNVFFKSDSLGYVVATHQVTQMKPLKTVLTYYWPLSHLSPQMARQQALRRSLDEWQAIILEELLRVHPEIKGQVERMDIWVWGHAMIRPTKNFIWGEARRQAQIDAAPIFLAHSDMSGISIFEEAHTRGVAAAEKALNYLKVPYSSRL